MNTAGVFFKRIGAGLNKYSPQILTGIGIGAGIGATVTACMATKKALPVIDQSKKAIYHIHTKMDEGEIEKKEGKKELAKTYRSTGLELGKYYALPFGLTAASVGCTLAGFGIMSGRAAAATMGFAALSSSFDMYRKRVIEEHGEEADKNYLYGTKDVTVKENEVDPETGEVKKVKKTIKEAIPGHEEIAPFDIVFDSGVNYEKDVNYNKQFIDAQCHLAQVKHSCEKVPMFLDKVLGEDFLGLPIKSEKQLKMYRNMGWPADVPVMFDPEIKYDEPDEDGIRGSYVVIHFHGLTVNPYSKKEN